MIYKLATRNINKIKSIRYLSNTPQEPWKLFDRESKLWHRERSVLHPELSRQTDYLKEEMGLRMVERLELIKRKFPFIVDLGSGAGHIAKHIDEDSTDKLIMCDISEKLLNRDIDNKYEVKVERKVMDEENLNLENNSVPAIISNLSLHWVNDLPGAFIQIKNALVPDGVFLGCMFGGDTLFELRTSLQLAEQERGGGISPRVSPFAEAKDISNLLSRAGFALTTVDVDEIVVNYPTMFHLLEDLDNMAESNAVIARQPFLKRDTLLAASAIYQAAHGNEDNTIPATFQIIYMIGWKPHESQPEAKQRGSAKKSLKEVL